MDVNALITDLKLLQTAKEKEVQLSEYVNSQVYKRWPQKTNEKGITHRQLTIDLKTADDILLWHLADRFLHFESFAIAVLLFGKEYPVNRYLGMGDTQDGLTTVFEDGHLELHYVSMCPIDYILEEYREEFRTTRKNMELLLEEVTKEFGITTKMNVA